MQYRMLSCPDASDERLGNAASPACRVNGQQSVVPSLNVLLISVVLGGTLFQLFGLPLALRAFGIQAAWFLLPIMLLQPLHLGAAILKAFMLACSPTVAPTNFAGACCQ